MKDNSIRDFLHQNETSLKFKISSKLWKEKYMQSVKIKLELPKRQIFVLVLKPSLQSEWVNL